ncbi:cytochrome c oxidase assembly protein [Mangrovicoccus sp. HB182678]|uniref:Cytochrome c oxidase assembly protein n=2 Tax=Mangrovicoccus algicola TaxID=2771008 RepID=A0A8J6YQD3_9RHOB|nr:cytochrome c oxidase assembly protein [Mangrovicoccus algicola]MBE3637623.1 cytochrome c oxidase assembly protein [Mangrovicoccus algicola]
MRRALPPALLAAGVPALVWAAGIVPGFAGHMIRHMGLVAVIAPLAVLSLPVLARLPVPPLAAALAEFAVVWVWHLPALHLAARISPGWFWAEQAAFLGAGLLVWATALRPGQDLAGAGAMLLTSMHMTLLGALLILAGRPLYAAICYGADPLADQRMGGMLMLAIGTPVYLAAGLWLVARRLGAEGETA